MKFYHGTLLTMAAFWPLVLSQFDGYLKICINDGDSEVGENVVFQGVAEIKACHSICLSSSCNGFTYDLSSKNCWVTYTSVVSIKSGTNCGKRSCQAYAKEGVFVDASPNSNNSTSGRSIPSNTGPTPPQTSPGVLGRSSLNQNMVRCSNGYCNACNAAGKCAVPTSPYMCADSTPCWEPCEIGTNYCYRPILKTMCFNGPCQCACNSTGYCGPERPIPVPVPVPPPTGRAIVPPPNPIPVNPPKVPVTPPSIPIAPPPVPISPKPIGGGACPPPLGGGSAGLYGSGGGLVSGISSLVGKSFKIKGKHLHKGKIKLKHRFKH